MSSLFGAAYAATYDLVYAEKDYRGECDTIERIIGGSSRNGPFRILDLGCGTGGHVAVLAERGHAVTGVDRSPAMLDIARERLRGLPVNLLQADIRSLELGETFDVALMMFAVLGYQTENDDALAALTTARRHLGPSGILLFDVWNGSAVIAQRPSERVQVLREGRRSIVRRSRGTLNVSRQLCHVEIEMLGFGDEDGPTEVAERHTMRFFFPRELELLLRMAGLRQLGSWSFPDGRAGPDERDWNIIVAAIVENADVGDTAL